MKKASKTPNPWKEVAVVTDNFKTCDHYFDFIGTECKCTKCSMGLIGVYKLEKGKPIV